MFHHPSLEGYTDLFGMAFWKIPSPARSMFGVGLTLNSNGPNLPLCQNGHIIAVLHAILSLVSVTTRNSCNAEYALHLTLVLMFQSNLKVLFHSKHNIYMSSKHFSNTVTCELPNIGTSIPLVCDGKTSKNVNH